MEHWALNELDLKPRLPEILSTDDDARVIVLDLETGQELGEHEVHERTWVVVIGGEIEVSSVNGGTATGGPGMLVEFAPGERHEVRAITEARLLLMLTPWPGKGHPGSMSMQEKLYVRRRAHKAQAEQKELAGEPPLKNR